MANEKAIETRKLAATTTNQIVDWGNPAINAIHLIADEATVQVDFDQPTDASSYLLPDGVEVIIEAPIHKLHVKTTSGTANLYMIGIRN